MNALINAAQFKNAPSDGVSRRRCWRFTVAVMLVALAEPALAADGPRPALSSAKMPGRAVPIANARALGPFFQALDRLRRAKPTRGADATVVRAMQFGDSHTAADFWTGRVREHLQQRFGHAGLGILLPARPWRGYAHAGVRESFEPSWPATSLRSSWSEGWVGMTGASLRLPLDAEYRVTGEFRWFEVLGLALPGEPADLAPRPAPRRSSPGDASVDAQASSAVAMASSVPGRDAVTAASEVVQAQASRSVEADTRPVVPPDIARPALSLARPSAPDPASPARASAPVLALPEGEPIHSKTSLAGGRVLHVLTQAMPSGLGPLELSVGLPRGAWLLGVELRSGRSGVLYDELGLNGAELFDLERWQPELRRFLLTRAHPQLLVLAYGTNEMGRRDLDPVAYRERATALLRQLRDESGAVILVVGPPDRGAARAARANELRAAGRAISDALKAAATDAGCAYWSAATAMGGAGAIVRWQKLGLARTDRVHLTPAGYQRLGDLQFEALMAAYDDYRRQHP